MFDLGLTKLAVIGIIALVVIGPKHLPRVARTAGSLLGRAQRTFNEVKAAVSREIETPFNEVTVGLGQQTATNTNDNDTNNTERHTHRLTQLSTARKKYSRAKRLIKRSVRLSNQYRRSTLRLRRHLQSGAARVLQMRHHACETRQSTRFF